MTLAATLAAVWLGLAVAATTGWHAAHIYVRRHQ